MQGGPGKKVNNVIANVRVPLTMLRRANRQTDNDSSSIILKSDLLSSRKSLGRNGDSKLNDSALKLESSKNDTNSLTATGLTFGTKMQQLEIAPPKIVRQPKSRDEKSRYKTEVMMGGASLTLNS